MATVTPQLRQGRWVVDLRAWGLGQRYVLSGVPPVETAREGAVHAAYQLLMRLRQGSAAESPQPIQERLPGTALGGGLGGDCLFRFACDEWAPRQQWRRTGSAAWAESNLAKVRRELGGLRIAQFEAPTGDDVLLNYVRLLCERGFKRGTRSTRVQIAMRVLAFCKRRGWLATLPERPRVTEQGAPAEAPIPFTPYTEVMFRALRAAIFADGVPRGACARGEEGDFIAKRRLYLSWAFYTGMHTIDLDGLRTETALLDFGSFMRVNTKSSRYVPDELFDMPEGLLLDCRAELARLGRPWRPGEAICGGDWPRGLRAVARATKAAGLPFFNFRTVARRSTVWNCALLGWSEEDCGRLLGHVDRKMISTVYRQYVPDRLRSPKKVPWTVENATKMPWRMDRPKPAAVIPFQRPAAAAEGDDE